MSFFRRPRLARPSPSSCAAPTVCRKFRPCILRSILLAGMVDGLPAFATPAAPRSGVHVTPSAALPSCPGLDFYRIETAAATYYLEKYGAGLAALIDRDGNDWISFRSEPGSRSAGEFRGFPNAVHQQAGNYFHPRNQSTDATITKIASTSADHATITAAAGNGLWAGRYDFFPGHCTFTMTRMSPNHKYWVLYEGTPGGKYDDADWWMTSAVKKPQLLSRNHEGDIPAPEWIAFGDQQAGRVLFLLQHEDDDRPDRYYPMNREMTVFGFGRMRGIKHLASVPRQFSIGLIETTDHESISRAIDQIRRPR